MASPPPQRFKVSYKGKLCNAFTILDPFGAWSEVQDNLAQLLPFRISIPHKSHAPQTKQDVAFRRRLSFQGLATCDFELEDPHTMSGTSCFDLPYLHLFILPPMDPLVYKTKVKHDLKEWIEVHKKHEWLLLYGLCNRVHALEAKQNAKTLAKIRHTFINLGVSTTRLAPVPMPGLHLVESEELVKCDEAENELTISYKDWNDLAHVISERLANTIVTMHTHIQHSIKSAEGAPHRNVKNLIFELDKLMALYIKCGMFQEACIGYSKIYTLLNHLYTADGIKFQYFESALPQLQFDFGCSNETMDFAPILEHIDKDYNGCVFTMKHFILERQLQLLSINFGIESLYCMCKFALAHFMDCYSRIVGIADFTNLIYTVVNNISLKFKNELESRFGFDLVDAYPVSRGVAEACGSLGNNLYPTTSLYTEETPPNYTLVSTDALKHRSKVHSIFKLNALKKRLATTTKWPGHNAEESNADGEANADEKVARELFVVHFCDTSNIIQSCWRCLGYLFSVAFKLLLVQGVSRTQDDDSNNCTLDKRLDALRASSECFLRGGLERFGQVQGNICNSIKTSAMDVIPWQKLRLHSYDVQSFAWIEPLNCDSNSDGCAVSFAAIGMDAIRQILAQDIDSVGTPSEMHMYTPVEAEPQVVALYLEALAHYKKRSVRPVPQERREGHEKSQVVSTNVDSVNSCAAMDATVSLPLDKIDSEYFEYKAAVLNSTKVFDKSPDVIQEATVDIIELPRPRMKMGKERRLIVWVHIKGHECPLHKGDGLLIYKVTATLKFFSSGLDSASTGDEKDDSADAREDIKLFGQTRLVEGANRIELNAEPLLDGVWRLDSLELRGGNLEAHRIRLATPIPLDFITPVAITAKKCLPLYWTPEAILALLVAPPDLVVEHQTIQVHGNICGAHALQVHAGCRHYVRLTTTMEHSLESLDLSLRLNGQAVASKPMFSNDGSNTLDVSWCVAVDVPRDNDEIVSSLTFGEDSSKTFEATFLVTNNSMHGSFHFIAPIVDVFELQTCSNEETLDLLVTTYLAVEIHSVKVGGDVGAEQCDVPVILSNMGKFRVVLNDRLHSFKDESTVGAANNFLLVSYKLYRSPCRHTHGGMLMAANSLEQVSELQHAKLTLPDTKGLITVDVVAPQFAHLGTEFEIVVQFKCTCKTSFDYTIPSDSNWLIGGAVDALGIELDETNEFHHEVRLTVVPLVQGTCTLPHVMLPRTNKQMVDSVQVFILPPKSDQRVI